VLEESILIESKWPLPKAEVRVEIWEIDKGLVV
jgi:hypothetical protein